jgi:ribose 5-phosphate isomerase B
MRVSIGSDHRGIEQRKTISDAIESAGHTVDDCGTFSTDSCDYPDIAYAVATKVAAGKSQMGVLVCGTGIGMSIAANKIKGVRAAVCCDLETAKLSRQHNNANILCLSGEAFDAGQYTDLVTQWLGTEFEGGRHARRVDKIVEIENGSLDPKV